MALHDVTLAIRYDLHHLHGDKHPPVSIRLGSSPLVYKGSPGEMELRLHVDGVLPQNQYHVAVQETCENGSIGQQST